MRMDEDRRNFNVLILGLSKDWRQVPLSLIALAPAAKIGNGVAGLEKWKRPMNLILIGMRCVGKSYVCRLLTVLTKRPVISTDMMVEYEAGQTIPEIIAADHGDWRRFRDLEFEAVRKTSVFKNIIIDGGGGVIIDLDAEGREIYSERKVAALKASGTIIWLSGDIPWLVEKAARKDAARPNLDAARSPEEIMRSRLPFYEAACDVSYDVKGMKCKNVAKMLFRDFEEKL